jgi:hypothetical protein
MQNCDGVAGAKLNFLAALRQLTSAGRADDDSDRVITISDAYLQALETHGGAFQREPAQTPDRL